MNEDLELFEVEISYIVPVLARDEQEAEEVARDADRDGLSFEEPEFNCITRLISLPSYYHNCIPYSKNGDNENYLTTGEIFAILKKRRAEKQREAEIDALQYKLPLFGKDASGLPDA
jgi:hypothetical protein